MNYLGHTISQGKVTIMPDRIEKILQFRSPKNLKELHKFTGLLSFYAKFIPNYSRIVNPLNRLKQKGAKFIWADIEEKCFQKTKQLLTSPPILALPDFDKQFVLTCDAFQTEIGAVLQMEIDGNLLPLHYASRALTECEQKYSMYRLEFLACPFGVEKFRMYLNKEFVLQTDNMAVSYILNKKNYRNNLLDGLSDNRSSISKLNTLGGP